MQLHISLDKDFENIFAEMKQKYPQFIKIEGLSSDKLDPMRFFKAFLKSNNVANVSIDDNSNVNSQNMPTLLDESRKPLLKLMSFNKIFIEMKEEFGLDVARDYFEKQISGDIFQHDGSLTSYQPYCYAYSLQSIAEHGLYFIKEMKANAPQHLDTFNSHYLEFCAFATNMQSGAVGTPDYLLWSYYFWRKDVDSGYIADSNKDIVRNQEFQKVVYSLNQPWMKISQSAYTNWSIMDRLYYEGLFGDLVFPNGEFAVDHIEAFMQYQKDFLDFIRAEREKKSFTFPVLSASSIFREGKFQDEDMMKYIVKHNMKWADVNIYKSDNPDALSSCCFDPNQKVLAKGQNVIYDTFENVHSMSHEEYKRNFRVFHNGNWVDGKLNKIPRDGREMYKVTTVNNKELLMTSDHLSLTTRGDILTEQLTEDDYLAFNTNELGFIPERNMKLTYEQGILIGAYLGDGSKDSGGGVMLSINPDKLKILIDPIKKAIDDWGVSCSISIAEKEHNNVAVRIGVGLLNIIEEWVYGDYCHEKEINLECLLQSPEFRQGIVDGLYITDGGNSNGIYSTSKKQTEGIEIILTSLGIQSIINISDRTDEPVTIRGQEFKRNYPLYCIRYYKRKGNSRKMNGVYKIINNTTYFKIKSIEKYVSDKDYVYCFEMKNEDEPYFTLPNGIITHNCRAEFSTTDINKGKKLEGNFNSIGGSDLNIGSSKVVTINFPRVGYKANGDYEVAKIEITKLVKLIQKFHKSHRDILQSNVDRGLLPLFSFGLMSFDKMFATIGIAGFEEYIEGMGGISENNIGEKYYNDKGIKVASDTLKLINSLGDGTVDKYGYTQNCEEIPGESCNIKLLNKDRITFGDNYMKDKITYSNQWIGLDTKCDLSERIKMSGILDNITSGGAILHANLGDKWNSFEDAWNFNVGVAKRGVKYWSEIRKYHYCENDHNFFNKKCPICGEDPKGDIVKIVGYLTKNEYYKSERKEELEHRVFYKL